MKLDYNRLNELLNVYGLSLKVENGNAIFVDVETNTPMKSYVVYKEGFADQSVEYTAEVNKLLDGWPFYVDTDNKHFRLNILFRDEDIRVSEITKIERKEPHLYESSELKPTGTSFTLKETTYKKTVREDGLEYLDRQCISDVSFAAIIIDSIDPKEGSIAVSKDKKRAYFNFRKNATSGEIVPYFEDEEITSYFEGSSDYIMGYQEATQLIEQSRLFKNTMQILCPTLAENYSSVKANTVGPTK